MTVRGRCLSDVSNAQHHEDVLVPAVYGQWAEHLTFAADIMLGDSVLDVGCGTGVAARKAKLQTGLKGRVVGLDRSEAMLEVARKLSDAVEWHQGDALELPFSEHVFDVVLSQFMLTHIHRPVAALKEMRRVLKESGRLAVAVWAPIETSLAYERLARLFEKWLGPKAARQLESAFDLGSHARLENLMGAAGFRNIRMENRKGTARFLSIKAFFEAQLSPVPAAHELNQNDLDAMLFEAAPMLLRWKQPSGGLVVPLSAVMVTAKKS